MEVKCNCCGIQFEKNNTEVKSSKTGKHYCSRTCSAKINNLGRMRNPAKLFICKNCNVEFKRTYSHKRRGLCKQCTEIWKSHTSKEFQDKLKLKDFFNSSSIKGKHPSWKSAHIRELNRRRWDFDKFGSCVVCGYDKHIELAHIKAISSFDENATIGEVNSIMNVLPLCRNHHWEFDNNSLDKKNEDKINKHIKILLEKNNG
jgi:hypothetical protein